MIVLFTHFMLSALSWNLCIAVFRVFCGIKNLCSLFLRIFRGICVGSCLLVQSSLIVCKSTWRNNNAALNYRCLFHHCFCFIPLFSNQVEIAPSARSAFPCTFDNYNIFIMNFQQNMPKTVGARMFDIFNGGFCMSSACFGRVWPSCYKLLYAIYKFAAVNVFFNHYGWNFWGWK